MNDPVIVWQNGTLVNADEVRISPFDLGYAVGWGAFETMPGYDGEVFGFSRHYQRLVHSASVLDIHVPDESLLVDAVEQVMQANGLTSGRSRVRLSLSGGEVSLFGGEEAKQARGNVIVNAVRVTEPEQVVSLLVSPYPHNERSGLSGCKVSSYGNNLMALRHAVAGGAGEAILLNTRGELCEAATANLFLVKDGVVRTPSLDSGCLAGVTRAVVLELCHEEGIRCDECVLTEDDLGKADEIFLTSSTREVQSAFLLGGNPIANPRITQQLARLFTRRVNKELNR